MNYICPICQKTAANFLPCGHPVALFDKYKVIGAGRRENCRCPHCGSKDRDRLTYLFLAHKKILIQKLALLHCAPESSLQKILLAKPGVAYISVDLNSPLAMYHMNMTALSFANNAFDLIIANHVLEHIPDDRRALSEMFRVLKPGGSAILQVPLAIAEPKTIQDLQAQGAMERLERFGQTDHIRLYGQDYFAKIESVGFVVKRHKPQDFLNTTEITNYALNPEEELIQAIKSL